MDTAETTPSRAVDAQHQGWYWSGSGLYEADYGHKRKLEPRSWPELVETRGPMRPVVPPSEASTAELRAALRAAGRLAAGSLLVALARIMLRISAKPGQPEATGSLLAGREGSWESDVMRTIVWNLGTDLMERPRRFDPAATDRLEAVITGWITGPDYTEIAENVAGDFGAVADELGGWDKVADAPFQPGGRFAHPDHVIEYVQGWLMSRSRTAFE